MEEKQKQYDELDRLENERLKELEISKKKLLKVIKDNEIDPNSLTTSYNTFPLDKTNLLENLEAFEKGKISISGFRSDNIERYLFDIAANRNVV